MLNPRQLIQIDKLLDIPYRILSYCFMRLGKVDAAENGQIFIIKMMGIGSITRIFRSLKDNQVDMSKVLFVTLSGNRELCELLGVKNVHYVTGNSIWGIGWNLLRLILFIRKQKPVHLINYERASNILGIFQIMSSFFTSIRSVSFHDFQQDIFRGNDAIVTIKGKSFQELIDETITYFPVMKKHTEESHAEVKVLSKKILININASDYMAYRKYPISGFQNVIKQLHLIDSEYVFDLVGSPAEKSYVKELTDLFEMDDITINNRCGQWSLFELMENLSDCALFITNDSGPLHLAASIDIPIIAIWGPTSSDYFGYSSANITNIQTTESCSPCFFYAKSNAAQECNQRIDCMNGIDASRIVSEAEQKLKNVDLVRFIDSRYMEKKLPDQKLKMVV